MIKAARRVASATLFVALIVSCVFPALATADAPWESWQSRLSTDDPLVGRIWSARSKTYITPQQLADALGSARFVLLGETHDNPDHHRLQAWLISRLAASGQRPAVVMEMISEDKADALQSYLADPGANPAGLGNALDWQKSGWPDWRIYQPIAEAALGVGLRIAAGDAARSRIRRVGREGFDALSAPERATLALDSDLSPPLARSLLEELFDSHCQMVPREAMTPMARVQRFRDAVLADSLLRESAKHGIGSVLVAGNGHVRKDRAVPWYLARRSPGDKVVSVMLIEVDGKATTPDELMPTYPDGRPASDFVWFTPRAEREDPCAALAKRFGKHKKPAAGQERKQ